MPSSVMIRSPGASLGEMHVPEYTQQVNPRGLAGVSGPRMIGIGRGYTKAKQTPLRKIGVCQFLLIFSLVRCT